MATVPKHLAEKAAALYIMMDENRQSDRMLLQLVIPTRFIATNEDPSGRDGVFSALDIWAGLLIDVNADGNDDSVEKADRHAAMILATFPEVAVARQRLLKRRI